METVTVILIILFVPVLLAVGVSKLIMTVLDRRGRRKEPTALLGVVSPKKEEE